MRIAEQVTFGGSGQLDRLVDVRRDSAAVDRLWDETDARALVFWRGKVLVEEAAEGGVSLALVRADHEVLADARGAPLLLGRSGGSVRFAADISRWVPGDAPATLAGFDDPSRRHHPALPNSFGFAGLRNIMTLLPPADAELAVMAKAILGWHETHQFCANCGAKTAVSVAGWQRNCAACGRQHFPRTDPVVIMLITHGHDLLIGRSPNWPDGVYSLLAGFMEPGETIEAAVRRETMEEAGIAVGKVAYLASQPWPFAASLMLGCHGRALNPDITLDPAELDDAMWISRGDLADVYAGTSTRVKAARKGSIARFLMQNWLADRLD